MERAVYAAMRERSVGLGVMGFHSFLQARGIPFECALAKSWNLKIFRKIRHDADAASVPLAYERGSCPDAADRGMRARFSHKLAIAPTASISIICGGASACVEPIPANIYTHKTFPAPFPCAIPICRGFSRKKERIRPTSGNPSSNRKARFSISTC